MIKRNTKNLQLLNAQVGYFKDLEKLLAVKECFLRG